jgi:sugar phosphate isomerase/epimerase
MSFDKCCEAMNNLGLRYIEVFPGHVAGMSPTQIKETLAKNNIKYMSYGVVPFTNKEADNRKMFEIAKQFGFSTLSCDPSPDSFDSLDKLCDEYGVSVGIHPHGPGHRWAKIETIWNAVKDHNKKIGLCADTGHLIRAGEDPLKACETMKDRLFELHLKDFKKKGENDWEDVPAAQGSLDVDGIIKFLLTNKFKGGIFIEYEGADPVNKSKESVDRVLEAIKKAKA